MYLSQSVTTALALVQTRLVAILVAQKYWDDYPLRNIDFAHAWSRVAPNEAPLSITDLNMLECAFLSALGFDLFVKSAQYFAVCEELVAEVQAREPHDAKVAELMRQHSSILSMRKSKVWYRLDYMSGALHINP